MAKHFPICDNAARPPEKPMKPILSALALVLGLAAQPLLADTLLIERVNVAGHQDLPRRGSSMAQVEARYGAPAEKFAAVGGGGPNTPPITRWQYPSFSVYFENSHVVNAVLTKASDLEIGPAPVSR
jgi:hypothetical protein